MFRPLLLDGWQLELHVMLCTCGSPGCPGKAWQVYAISPEEAFDDAAELYSDITGAALQSAPTTRQ